MRSVNPVCKLVGLVVISLALAAAHDPFANIVAFIACIALMATSRVPLRSVLLRMAPLVLVAFGLFMTGYRFASEGGVSVEGGRLPINDPAVLNGLILSTRVLAYAGLGFLFVLTTDKLGLVRSLQQQFRMPATFAYALIAAWNLLPDMEREYRRTRFAFVARGLNPWPLSSMLLKPMLVKTMLWSQTLAMAMESRGFDGRSPRTEWEIMRVTPRDVLFLIVCGAGVAVIAGVL